MPHLPDIEVIQKTRANVHSKVDIQMKQQTVLQIWLAAG